MRGRRSVAWAGAALVGLACASLGYQQGYQARAERLIAVKPELDGWRAGFERDRRSVEAQKAAAEQWIDEAARELSRMQVSIIRLDALAARLVERTGLDAREFDFRAAPAVGGPEEAPAEHEPVEWEGDAQSVADQIDDRRQQMQILEEVLKWRELHASVMPEGRPVQAAYVSSPFGARIDPFTGRRAAHKGVDFAGPMGTEVVAVAAGIVTWSGGRSGYGQLVEVDHGGGIVTRYAHNSKNLVQVGDVVTRGQTIALLGNTGRATGPNLHFEVLRDGEAVDPLPFVE